MQKIGIIAGNRKFPLILAEAARGKGYYTVAVAVKKDTSRRIHDCADKVYWVGLNDYSRLFDIFKSEGIANVVMAGQISPHRLFGREIKLDLRLKKILGEISDKKADSIFGAIARELKSEGLELMDSTLFLQEYLPKKGALTRQVPNFDQWEDVYFGFELAKEMGLLDIGQTVAVKEKAVVAVEALEGTDNLIRRAGKIARNGVTVVKVSKPGQDKRFDIPVVGLNTVKNLVRIKAACLAIEAEKTLFIDRQESVRLADRYGLAIVAV